MDENKNLVGSKKLYSIKDLATEFSVSLRTLRFYESRGLISPYRDGLNRLYSENDRQRLSAILQGKQLGFTLTEISEMLARSPKNVDKSAELKIPVRLVDKQLQFLETQKAEVEMAIEELQKYKMEFC
ncbi:MerR family transcriptional regulator [Microvirga sp. W0021]|uniref:MerR family transcriptional regulator n=1 Tax=Hohaiivirga grylli TaxID=3133970 RepID=A0ABV0BGR5_9HYPH